MAGTAQVMWEESLWQKFVAMVLHRRVRITAIIFYALIAQDVLIERVAPHNLTNLRDYKVVGGLGLVFAGLALRSWAAGTLHKRSQLATSGPYELVRHPLYIGSYLMMLGFCCLVDDRENILFVAGPILFLYILRAVHEEKFLATLFPNEWPAFSSAVPRFVPRRIPTTWFNDWTFRQWMKNREYQAMSAVLMGLVLIQIWHMMYARIAS
jgi:protein-S-isoprenylcysteine O-methyltransferase Ste14